MEGLFIVSQEWNSHMIGLKIKYLFILSLGLLSSINSFSQQKRQNSFGFSLGYTESLNFFQGINYNLFYGREINQKFIYQLNAYWVSENNSSFDFTNGGPSFNLTDFANIEIGNKVLQDETSLTGIEAGIGYKLIDKSNWSIFLNGGLNYQKLISKTVETSVIPGQGDMTNLGVFSSSYNKNHIGYFAGIVTLARLAPKIWIGPEIKWRGYFGINPQPHPVIFNSLNMNSINLNLKLIIDL